MGIKHILKCIRYSLKSGILCIFEILTIVVFQFSELKDNNGKDLENAQFLHFRNPDF